jgi:hypothetical protein
MGKVMKKTVKSDITQAELKELWDNQILLAELKHKVETAVEALTVRVENGETAEAGSYGVTIKETKRVNISWKGAYEDLCEKTGKSFPLMESTLKAETAPSVTRKAQVVLLEGL